MSCSPRGSSASRALFLSLAMTVLAGCNSTRYEGGEAGDCTDGTDNDADGAYDCLDSGCALAPACLEPPIPDPVVFQEGAMFGGPIAVRDFGTAGPVVSTGTARLLILPEDDLRVIARRRPDVYARLTGQEETD